MDELIRRYTDTAADRQGAAAKKKKLGQM